MAISGVSLASPASFQNPNDPRQQFVELAKTINSGNLTGAQQTYVLAGDALVSLGEALQTIVSAASG
jgi:hypothetical protein